MRITIRFGSETDASALAELAARTFEETFAADNRDEDMALYLAEAYGTSQQLEELIDPDITTLHHSRTIEEGIAQLAREAELVSV